MSEKGALWDIDRIWAKVQIGEGTASWGREQTKVIIDKQIDSYRTALKKKIEQMRDNFPIVGDLNNYQLGKNKALEQVIDLIDSTTI